jgi:cycloeucalenol cycloisomerase
MDRMLAYGSIMYSCYFIASFPIYYFLDETWEKPWSLIQTFLYASAAGTLTLYLLDFWTHIIGPIY